MSSNLESRVERRFLEIEGRLRGRPITAVPPEVLKPTSYVDDQIDKYEFYLNKAYESAPCGGCKKLVESAIVGVRIFKYMEKDNLKRQDITDEKIQKIKEQVKRELRP